MNKHISSTKLLIMFDFLICCKLTFDLYFKNFLNFILKLKFNIYMHKKIFASYITIHLHK